MAEKENEPPCEEVPEDFFPDAEDVHETCGEKFLDCCCFFKKKVFTFARGKEQSYICLCHPLWYDHCECYFDVFYDPDGLLSD